MSRTLPSWGIAGLGELLDSRAAAWARRRDDLHTVARSTTRDLDTKGQVGQV